MEDHMAPALGELRIRPSKGVRFQAKLDIFRLKHLCLFTVHANSLNVQKRPPHDFIGVNVPVGRQELRGIFHPQGALSESSKRISLGLLG